MPTVCNGYNGPNINIVPVGRTVQYSQGQIYYIHYTLYAVPRPSAQLYLKIFVSVSTIYVQIVHLHAYYITSGF
jgi:hypothetical protein